MITEKNTIKAEAVYDDTKQHRLWWAHKWNNQKPMACIITLHPSTSDTIVMDMTTFLCENGVAKLEEYGGVIIVNLFSLLTSKLQMRWARDIDINHLENDNYIKKAAEESSKIIFAWGRGANNVRILRRARQVVDLISKHKEKFRVISDGKRKLLHPLTPECRNMTWILESFNYEEAFADILEDKRGEETAKTNENAPT